MFVTRYVRSLCEGPASRSIAMRAAQPKSETRADASYCSERSAAGPSIRSTSGTPPDMENVLGHQVHPRRHLNV